MSLKFYTGERPVVNCFETEIIKEKDFIITLFRKSYNKDDLLLKDDLLEEELEKNGFIYFKIKNKKYLEENGIIEFPTLRIRSSKGEKKLNFEEAMEWLKTEEAEQTRLEAMESFLERERKKTLGEHVEVDEEMMHSLEEYPNEFNDLYWLITVYPILYTTGCPKCKVLEKKLNEKGIKFIALDDKEQMLSEGITEVPMLEVCYEEKSEFKNKLLNFNEAIEWIKKCNKLTLN